MGQQGNEVNIKGILEQVIHKRASDLHLKVRRPPVMRISGELLAQEHLPKLTIEDISQAFTDITTEEQRKLFAKDMELDFALSLSGIGRFRVNASFQRGTLTLSFRVVHTTIPGMDELGLPEVCKMLALRQGGLVLVCGPAGSGKSTTLAAIVEYINSTECRHIITIEDPIEYLHRDKKCFISQREVGSDTRSFPVALKHALRQDPDVIVVGEMRDIETMSTVMTAAETGHLVLTTLHAPSAIKAIHRIIDAFPHDRQQQARIQLSTSLQGVLCQTLVPKRDGAGCVVAMEVMVATDAIRNSIQGGKTREMLDVMRNGDYSGMRTLDQALTDLCLRGLITPEETLARCRDPETAKEFIAALATNQATGGQIYPRFRTLFPL